MVRGTPQLTSTPATTLTPAGVVIRGLASAAVGTLAMDVKAPPFSWPGALVAEHLAGRPLSTAPTGGTS
jgi:hypothetical protein